MSRHKTGGTSEKGETGQNFCFACLPCLAILASLARFTCLAQIQFLIQDFLK